MEIELTRAVAALDATLSGFARDVNRRFDELSRDTREIKVQVKETNGRVNAHDTKIAALEDDVKALATQADDNKPALTRREWRLVWGLLATVCGLVLTMAKLAHELWVLP